ncbi:DUF4942 domain-containing protein [Stenotrophomonas maltophilia]|nr:DUF4942 domain-containing protein [Stenotrophomonas maltophilia]
MNELLPGLDFSGYIQGRAEICNRIRRGFDEIEDAIKMAKDGKLFDRRLHEGKRYLSRTESELIDTIDRSAWRYLMEQSGLWSFLNDARRDEWTRGLGGYDPVPEFSSDNVEATFRQYYESRAEMRDEGLRDIYLELSRDHKCNDHHYLAEKCIVKLSDWTGGFDQSSVNVIDDLARVMCSLDGKPEFDHRITTFRMLNLNCWEDAPWNDYFSLKIFKNKNGHIKFKRLDLLERLNSEIGRVFSNALPSEIKS